MVNGLILAGGRSRRFGAEKAAAQLGGVSLLERACAQLGGTCDQVAVSAPAGGEAERLAVRLGLVRLEDPPGSPRGPLSGVLAGLHWTRGVGELLLTAPCDAPLLPQDLAERLLAAIGAAPAAVARSPGGLQPLCAIWRTMMIRPLQAALADGLHPPAHRILADANAVIVDFPDEAAFLNVNTPEDFAEAERRLKAR
jgi:molybdopterin-guanine dinucleotide biosynthesis protein A